MSLKVNTESSFSKSAIFNKKCKNLNISDSSQELSYTEKKISMVTTKIGDESQNSMISQNNENFGLDCQNLVEKF